PPALALAKYYTYKSIDNWDGKVGVRAIGLTFHPRELAFQAIVCFSLIGGMAFVRKLHRWELASLILLSGVMLFTQARGFYPVLVVMWIVVGIPMLRNDRSTILRVVTIGITLFLLAITIAPNRFGYMRQSTSLEQDTSYQFREEGPWKQLDKIYEERPWTGIGPDSMLFLGQGYKDPKFGTHMIMESAYRVFLAMYGLPGLFLLIVGLGGTIVVCALVAFNRRENDVRRCIAATGIVVAAALAINGHATNTFDGYMQLPAAMLIAGLAMRTRQEEAELQRRRHGSYRLDFAGATEPYPTLNGSQEGPKEQERPKARAL
ncbi:MAG TPA: O-antigen ligase family protein, partial [Fimbriimonadaceae bacterium]|nr:O-antigen ligase family protein [Fimbriimonadaceae bacterium]